MYLLNAYLFRLESRRDPVLKSGGTDPHRFEHFESKPSESGLLLNVLFPRPLV